MKSNPSPLSALLFLALAALWLMTSSCTESDGDAHTGNTTASQDVAALTQRLERIERRLAEQENTHAAERQLMIHALEASTERLDTVLGALLDGKIKPAKSSRSSRDPDLPPGKGKVTKIADPATEGGEANLPSRVHSRVSSRVPNPGPSSVPGPVASTGAKTAASAGTDGDTSEAPDSNAANAATPPPSSFFADLDLAQVIVIFLAVSLLLLVLVVVFFPGRLRSSVPTVEYSAIEDEAIAGLQVDPVAEAYAVAASRGSDAVAPGPSAFTPTTTDHDQQHPPGDMGAGDPDTPGFDASDRPVAHEIAIAVPDPSDITGLAEVLNTFLSTDPYILNEPAPQVALEADELHLRFFALPTLSEAEHALLDDAVRRLTPPSRDGPDAPGAPGAPQSAAS